MNNFIWIRWSLTEYDGYVFRIEEYKQPKKIPQWISAGRRKRGRSWKDEAEATKKGGGVSEEDWRDWVGICKWSNNDRCKLHLIMKKN